MDFAKVFQIKDNEQLLVTLDFDDDNGNAKVSFTTEHDYYRPSLAFEFKTEESAIDYMNEVDYEKASEIYKTLLATITELTEGD